jgi:hypothetical protein
VSFTYEINAGKRRNYDELAKKDHLKPVEVELKKIEDLVNQIREDFSYMKDREAAHRDTNGTPRIFLS